MNAEQRILERSRVFLLLTQTLAQELDFGLSFILVLFCFFILFFLFVEEPNLDVSQGAFT